MNPTHKAGQTEGRSGSHRKSRSRSSRTSGRPPSSRPIPIRNSGQAQQEHHTRLPVPSQSCPPDAPIIGSLPAPMMKVKGMPDLSLPPPSPEASSFFSGGMSTRFAASAPATSFMHQAQKSRFDPSPQGEELGKSPTVLSYVGSLSKRKVSFGGKDAEEGKASIGSGSIASVSSILGRDLTMPLGSIDEGFEDGMFPLPARAGTTSNPELDKSTLKLEQFKLSAGAPSKPIPFVRQVSDFSDPGRVSDRGEEEDTSSSSEDDDDSRPTVEDEGVFMFESDM